MKNKLSFFTNLLLECLIILFSISCTHHANKGQVELNKVSRPSIKSLNIRHEVFQHPDLSKYGLSFETISEKKFRELVATLIDEYSTQLTITSKDVLIKEIRKEKDWWTASLQQMFGGVPVFFTSGRITIARRGDVIELWLDVYPDIHCSTIPKIEASQALEIGFKEMNGDNQYQGWPQLIIFPHWPDSTIAHHLAWNVTIGIGNPYRFFISAEDGKILMKQQAWIDN